MIAPATWLERRGQVVECRYCGARIMLCEYTAPSGRVLRRAVDEDTPRAGVPRVAWFLVRNPGFVRRPGRAGRINPWHLFTCRKAPEANRRAKERLLAAALRASRPKPSSPSRAARPRGVPVIVRRRRSATTTSR